MKLLFFLVINIKRNIMQQTVVVLLLCSLCCFACFYTGYVECKEKELEGAYESIPVEIVVSNIQGTQTNNLNIPEYIFSAFTSEEGIYQNKSLLPYLEDVVLRSSLFYSVNVKNEPHVVENSKRSQRLVGISSIEAAPELDTTEGIEIIIFEPYTLELLSTSDPVCIVSNKFLEQLNIGNNGCYEIRLNVHWSIDALNTESIVLKVIGCYSGESNVIYCSWDTVAYLQNLLDGEVIVDSMSATVSDNRKLNDIRQILALHFAEVDPSGEPKEKIDSPVLEYYQFAATIYDKTFRNTINELTRNLRMLHRINPIIHTIELVSSAVLCFFFTILQRKEFTLMRALGTTRRLVISIGVLEIFFQYAISILISSTIDDFLFDNEIDILFVAMMGLAAIGGALSAGLLATGKKPLQNIKEVS